MKKLEIVIRDEKLEDFKKILYDYRDNDIMISHIRAHGNQKEYKTIYRGTEYNVNLLPKIKVEIVVPSDVADVIIEKVLKEISTDNYDDGKIFIYNVEDVVRIRTGERVKDAL
ncbi:P-II family nitrogen regulator [Clostridium saccharobutylicum]|uniref:Nitrogen regulatory protein P-II 1 n=1 Tax=Clostridium saccharobutylicum TaxID=169679 RepID=A0A1S8NDW8_CLOSA|nr:P-II family nitrogen regulator [Clostridium saccharobutylicum]OOM14674.1 nitrogen regulatory protein P-II 1 [Clostridium saccharobutylicum]